MRGISQPFFLISILSLPQRKFLPLLAALPASLGPAKSILQPRIPRFLFKNPQLSESGIFTRSAVSSIFSAIILIIQKALFPCTAAAAMIAFPAHVSVSGTASAVVAEQHHQNDDNAQSNKNPGQNS